MPALDDPARLRAVVDALADGEPDAELDRLVEEARVALQAPIALVSLVGRRAQVFRAQVGLPEELAVACGTSRSNSFCQVVVTTANALIVRDASTDERVPKELVERYGIRAYIGVPIHDRAQVIGTLCVIDVVPRDFDELALQSLYVLAELASRRVGELARAHTVRALRIPAQDREVVLRGLRRELTVLRDALRVIEPRMRAVEHLEHDVQFMSPALGRASIADALSFHGELERIVRDLDAATAALGPGNDALSEHCTRLKLLAVELARYARLAKAYLGRTLDAAAVERALRVTRDLAGAYGEIVTVSQAFAAALDASERAAASERSRP